MTGRTSRVQLDTSKLPGHSAGTGAPAAAGSLEERVLAALKTCYDPELPIQGGGRPRRDLGPGGVGVGPALGPEPYVGSCAAPTRPLTGGQ